MIKKRRLYFKTDLIKEVLYGTILPVKIFRTYVYKVFENYNFMKIRNAKNWKCKFCGKAYDTVQGLRIHLGKKQKKIEKNMSKEVLSLLRVIILSVTFG